MGKRRRPHLAPCFVKRGSLPMRASQAAPLTAHSSPRHQLVEEIDREWSMPQPAAPAAPSAGPSASADEPIEPKAPLDGIQKAFAEAASQWAHWWKAALPRSATTPDRSA